MFECKRVYSITEREEGKRSTHSVVELLLAGHDVVAVDNCCNAAADGEGQAISLLRVQEITGKPLVFVRCDLRDEGQLRAAFERARPLRQTSAPIDCVIHFAALKAVGESVAKPLEYYTNNLVATLNLFKLCKEFSVRKVILSSSATVYGAPASLPIKEDAPVGVGVTNPYGQTKWMMERILTDLGNTPGEEWSIIILRYFNPTGAHPSGRMGEDPRGPPNNLMPFVSQALLLPPSPSRDFVQVAVGKRPFLTIHGDNFPTPDGTGVRDYIHVVDLAKGHVKALERLESGDVQGTEVYNLGMGRGYSVKEMVAAFEGASGRTIETRVGEPRAGDLPAVYCDPSAAAEKLGWKAELGLEEMCRDLWKWQSMNPNGFE